jgi:hypothetical protein
MISLTSLFRLNLKTLQIILFSLHIKLHFDLFQLQPKMIYKTNIFSLILPKYINTHYS